MSLACLLADHVKRTIRATRGFRVAGLDWLVPWLTYTVSPALARLAPGRTVEFNGFSARLGFGDLYTFANLFEDYPIAELRQALGEVQKVIDAGANVGAFSWLVLQTARQIRRKIPVTAIEPAPENVTQLESQPFASELSVKSGAIGAQTGKGWLKPGHNSVTHTVAFARDNCDSAEVKIFDLESLCEVPVLLKLDVEGGEYSILRKGLPAQVLYMFLEWHAGSEADRPEDPRALVPLGVWRLISRDLYGSSTWFWKRR